MSDQREFWNERFAKEGYFYGTTPNLYIASHIDRLKSASSILFLGEGEGRNAAYAAKLGHIVSALDASEIGLEKARALSHSFGCEITTIHTDLEVWEPTERYDAILCSFLHLPEPLRSDVFAKVTRHLTPNGVFAGEFFSIHQLPKTTGGPKDTSLLYTSDAIQTLLTSLSCTIEELYETDTELHEGKGHIGVASVLRMAVRV